MSDLIEEARKKLDKLCDNAYKAGYIKGFLDAMSGKSEVEKYAEELKKEVEGEKDAE